MAGEFVYLGVLVLHIFSVMTAVGAVFVTDYLHLLGLRDRVLEKRALFLYPLIGKLIVGALAGIYITGFILAAMNPAVLANSLFRLKMALVLIVTINGFILHHRVFPDLEQDILKGKMRGATMHIAALGGSISVVTWVSIVTLSLTKTYAYDPWIFGTLYTFGVFVTYIFSIWLEDKMRG
jgi:hypothetical protein